MGEMLHFGERARPLFGVFHPATGPARAGAVLVCPPWGSESLRAHRGLRMLADHLAAAGWPVLRFDYGGTGDSAGDGAECSLDGWIADIRQAARELAGLSQASRVGVLGVRVGALLALEALRRQSIRPARVWAWDTPAGGAAFVQAMQRLENANEAFRNRYRSHDIALPPPPPGDLFGHAWPPAVAGPFAALDATPLLAQPNVLALASADAPFVPAGAARLPDDAHWEEYPWAAAPWLPRASFGPLSEKLRDGGL